MVAYKLQSKFADAGESVGKRQTIHQASTEVAENARE